MNEQTIAEAGKIYAASWQSSHQSFVSEATLEKHTPARQVEALREAQKDGWKLFLCFDQQTAVGMVGLNFTTGEIGLLYVQPGHWGKGYGRQMLDFAVPEMQKHTTPFLTVLNLNTRAKEIYEKYGFVATGEERVLSELKNLKELKYVYQKKSVSE